VFAAAAAFAWLACLLLCMYFCRGVRKKCYLWMYLAMVALLTSQLLQLWQNWDTSMPGEYFRSFQSMLQILAAILVAGGVLSSD